MTLLTMIGFTIALAAPAMWNLRTTRDTMHNHSACFPLCAFHIVRSATSAPTEIVAVPPMAVQSIDAFVQNLQRRRENAAVTIQSDHRPDIVLVIIESMRPELVDEQTMPTLCRYAQKGIHCQRHFSTGNATSHGIFGLFNGTDATLYSQFSSDESLLTRLFHQAGYELGFFAGHNDWQEFRMDGFVNADHFDRFQIEECDWLKSDRRATLRAKAFLDESDRPPRLAVLYLYSTHADYHSYPQDQIFQPAADDRFLIPYSLRDKPAVWNRYRNSAHFVDRCLDAVLADDRVVIVTGDHGESFLEDGVCGHGTRISKFQNMTPAVIYVPGGIPKTISEPTSHADLLPTVLAAADMIVDDETLLTGQNLGAITQSRLAKRFVVTRDYLTNELALVASHFADESNVFAIRFQFSPADGTTKILGAIDASGNQTATSLGLSERLVPQWIIDRLEWKHPR